MMEYIKQKLTDIDDRMRRFNIGSNEESSIFEGKKRIVFNPSYKSSELEFGVFINIFFSF